MASFFALGAGDSEIPLGRTGLNFCFFFGAAPTERSAQRIVQTKIVQFGWRLMGGNLVLEFSDVQAIEFD